MGRTDLDGLDLGHAARRISGRGHAEIAHSDHHYTDSLGTTVSKRRRLDVSCDNGIIVQLQQFDRLCSYLSQSRVKETGDASTICLADDGSAWYMWFSLARSAGSGHRTLAAFSMKRIRRTELARTRTSILRHALAENIITAGGAPIILTKARESHCLVKLMSNQFFSFYLVDLKIKRVTSKVKKNNIIFFVFIN